MKTHSTFNGVTLHAVNDYGSAGTSAITATAVEPAAATHWAAWDGQCAAFESDNCIAGMEDAVRGLIGPERNARTMGRVHVTSAPAAKHQPAAWAKWTKKWTARTAAGTAY